MISLLISKRLLLSIVIWSLCFLFSKCYFYWSPAVNGPVLKRLRARVSTALRVGIVCSAGGALGLLLLIHRFDEMAIMAALVGCLPPVCIGWALREALLCKDGISTRNGLFIFWFEVDRYSWSPLEEGWLLLTVDFQSDRFDAFPAVWVVPNEISSWRGQVGVEVDAQDQGAVDRILSETHGAQSGRAVRRLEFLD